MARQLLFTILSLFSVSVNAGPVETVFTYQGELQFMAAKASGPFDFQFQLFDALSGGTAVSTTVQADDVDVIDGVFTVQLDFGAIPFDGNQLWMQVAVREGADNGSFTPLTPRQKLTSAPFAILASSVVDGSISNPKLAADAVTSAKIMDGSIVAQDVDDSEIQRRVINTCLAGQAIRVISSNGSVSCQEVGASTRILIIDAADFVPESSTIAYIPSNPEGGACITENGTRSIFAPVNVPDGATIESYFVRLYDASGENDLSIELQKVDVTMAGILDIWAADYGGGTPGWVAATGTFVDDVASLNSHTYRIRASANWMAGECPIQILSVGINYTE